MCGMRFTLVWGLFCCVLVCLLLFIFVCCVVIGVIYGCGYLFGFACLVWDRLLVLFWVLGIVVFVVWVADWLGLF